MLFLEFRKAFMALRKRKVLPPKLLKGISISTVKYSNALCGKQLSLNMSSGTTLRPVAFKKLVLAMKLTAFLFLVCLQVHAKVNSQNINFSGRSVKLKTVFSIIEDQTGFTVAGNTALLKKANAVTIEARNEPLQQFLSRLLSDQAIGFIIRKKSIILSERSLPSPKTMPVTELSAPVVQNADVIKGRVVDSSGSPLIGASVQVKGLAIGAKTDANGYFTIDAQIGQTLEVSFVGYYRTEVVIRDLSPLNIVLSVVESSLDEMVVIGYGAVRKRDLTGAVSNVKGQTINEFPALSVSSALQGRVSGVQVGAINGQPGAGMQVRIRGANSIKGSNDPVWIINGAPGDINMINTADIESVEVLKDASATAIYGSRGANGVVIITTKGAKAGKLRTTLDASIGMQKLVSQIEMLSAKEYMQYLNKKAAINGQQPVYTDAQIAENNVNTNWQDEVFRNALLQNYAVDVSGGTDKMQGSFGVSYFGQNGIVKNSGYERISIRTDLKYMISKFITASANIIYSRSNHDQMNSQGSSRGSSVISGALVAPPTALPRNPDGTWNSFVDEPSGGQNPVAYLNEIRNKWYSNRILANAGLTIKPIKDLTVQLMANMRNEGSREDYYKSLKYPNSQGAASITIGDGTYFTNNNIITYDKGFGKHHINVMGGVTYEESTSKPVFTGTALGFLSDVVESYDLDAAQVKGLPTSGYSNWKLISGLGRINYNFDDRYLVTASIRSDGSSRYSRGNKWGYFPSAALAWRISQEKFLRREDWLSDLKFRVSYGKTGSTAIAPYSTQNTLEAVNIVLDNTTVVGYAPRNTYLGDLRWETTAQWNAGIDLALFNNRLRLTSDYYYKITTDLLNDVELPRSSGYTTALRNIGSISNRGFEFDIDARVIDKDIKWNLGANFSLNRSKVLKLADDKDIFGGTVSNTIISDQLNLMRVNLPMYMFFGYQEEGYDDKGQIVYKDLDGDGKITTSDRTIIGNPNPDYLLNFNTTVSYKGFTLSAFLQSVKGNDIFSLSMASVAYDYGYNANTLREVNDNHWTPSNTNAKYPNLLQNINLRMSDRFVYDGSYVRVKNIELGYNLPSKVSGGFQNARLFASAQNLFTFTSFPFWDPDINAGGGGSSLIQGVDSNNYPSARTFTLGCRLVF